MILKNIYSLTLLLIYVPADLCEYPRVKHKREKGNPTPQPPKGAYGTLESWGRYAGAPAEARESRGEAVSRTWGRVCVCVCVMATGHHLRFFQIQ